MARILLHIGLPKTGTTTLQYYLRQAQPGALGDVAYCRFFNSDIIQSRCFVNAVGLGRDSGLKDTPAAYAERIARQIDAGANTCIVSDETLSKVDGIDRSLMQEMLARLSDLGEVEIVMAVRPWFSWLESLINQCVKAGHLDPNLSDRNVTRSINGYATSFLKVYSFYHFGAQYYDGGVLWPVRLIEPGSDIMGVFSRLLGVSLPDSDAASNKNQSPPVSASVKRYLTAHGVTHDQVPEFPGFLSRADVDGLYASNRDWLGKFQRIAGPDILIDDYDVFREKIGPDGALGYLFGQFPDKVGIPPTGVR